MNTLFFVITLFSLLGILAITVRFLRSRPPLWIGKLPTAEPITQEIPAKAFDGLETVAPSASELIASLPPISVPSMLRQMKATSIGVTTVSALGIQDGHEKGTREILRMVRATLPPGNPT